MGRRKQRHQNGIPCSRREPSHIFRGIKFTCAEKTKAESGEGKQSRALQARAGRPGVKGMCNHLFANRLQLTKTAFQIPHNLATGNGPGVGEQLQDQGGGQEDET